MLALIVSLCWCDLAWFGLPVCLGCLLVDCCALPIGVCCLVVLRCPLVRAFVLRRWLPLVPAGGGWAGARCCLWLCVVDVWRVWFCAVVCRCSRRALVCIVAQFVWSWLGLPGDDRRCLLFVVVCLCCRLSVAGCLAYMVPAASCSWLLLLAVVMLLCVALPLPVGSPACRPSSSLVYFVGASWCFANAARPCARVLCCWFGWLFVGVFLCLFRLFVCLFVCLCVCVECVSVARPCVVVGVVCVALCVFDCVRASSCGWLCVS